MSNNPAETSGDQAQAASAESVPASEQIREHSPIVPHADSFSLSALFLLMVTVAALLGFASNALPGRTVVTSETSQYAKTPRDTPFLWFATGVLVFIGLVEGGRVGYFLHRRFSTMLVGSFYGMVAAAVPAAALFHPPSWKMILFSCGLLVAIGVVLGAKPKRTVSGSP